MGESHRLFIISYFKYISVFTIKSLKTQITCLTCSIFASKLNTFSKEHLFIKQTSWRWEQFGLHRTPGFLLRNNRGTTQLWQHATVFPHPVWGSKGQGCHSVLFVILGYTNEMSLIDSKAKATTFLSEWWVLVHMLENWNVYCMNKYIYFRIFICIYVHIYTIYWMHAYANDHNQTLEF